MDYTTSLQYRISQLLKLPVWIFSISFTIGTLILIFHFFGDRNISYAIGFLYLLFAAFVNASALGAMIICSFIFKEYQNQILQKAAILLVNIPVAIFYAYLAIADPFTQSHVNYQF